MILTFLFIIITLLGIISIKLNKSYYNEFLEIFGCANTVIGSIFLLISIIAIIVSHITVSKIIQENKIEYEGLCKRYEIVKSEYEDVSKSDVIGDITAWNMEVYNTKYWTYNPWTNWFNPKKIADNLYYIPLDEESEVDNGNVD